MASRSADSEIVFKQQSSPGKDNLTPKVPQDKPKDLRERLSFRPWRLSTPRLSTTNATPSTPTSPLAQPKRSDQTTVKETPRELDGPVDNLHSTLLAVVDKLGKLEQKVSDEQSHVYQYLDSRLSAMWEKVHAQQGAQELGPPRSTQGGEPRAEIDNSANWPTTSGNTFATDKPRLRPTPFDGTTSWDDYKAQFDLVAELNGWDDTTKAIYLATNLRGAAQTLLGDLEPSRRRDITALTDALEARFGSSSQTEVYKAQLRGRVRGRDESLPELAQAITRLTKRAYHTAPLALQDTLARDHFIDALPDSEFRWKIHQTRPKSLREALTTATELEAFLAADKQRAHTARVLSAPESSAPPRKSVEDELREIKEMLRALTSSGKTSQTTTSREGKERMTKCWNCGQGGHLKRECPLPNKGDDRQGNGHQSSFRA